MFFFIKSLNNNPIGHSVEPHKYWTLGSRSQLPFIGSGVVLQRFSKAPLKKKTPKSA